MSFNTTTAPIFFSSLPSFLAKMSSSSSSHENFSPLEHTNIHLLISFLTQIFLPPCDERACIQPAATYWAKSEGWQSEGGLSFPLCCHVIVNEPIKIIQKTKSDKRRRKPTWNRHEIVLILMFSEVFYQSIFLAISNSFSSYEVIQIISELQLQTDTEGNRYRTFTQ